MTMKPGSGSTHERRPRRGGVWAPPVPVEPGHGIPQRTIDVIIPALNEQASLPLVLEAIPWGWVRRVIVVDNGSEDATAARAAMGGAQVVAEPRRGYGRACLSGLAHLAQDPPEVVVFLDADFSDVPQELPRVVAPILTDGADMVIGSRMIGQREPGALLPQALLGNRLAGLLIRALHGYRFTDLGPFRAITWGALQGLGMKDTNFGWTVEMQLKAAAAGLDCVEVPVSYRRRVGVSKITGTVRGTILASYKILYTIARHARAG